MASLINRGALIVLEGCDRVGKTTQCKLLSSKLANLGRKVQFMNFPNRATPCGQLIDSYLRNSKNFGDEEIHLLFTLNRWEAKTEMTRLLNEGTTLIVDRYSYSGVAFSAAKGLDINWCKAPEAGLLKPDLVIFLTLTEDASKMRNGYGEERYETPKFQKNVKQVYEKLMERDLWQIIDADKPEEKLNEKLLDIVQTAMHNAKDKPLGQLW